MQLISPADEQPVARISLGSAADVDAAVKAARRAFSSFAATSRDERLALLNRILSEYKARHSEIADAIRVEMGAPTWLAKKAQAQPASRIYSRRSPCS